MLNTGKLLVSGRVFRVALAFLLVFLCSNSFSQKSVKPTGTGSINDPYQIGSLGNLYWLSQVDSIWGDSAYFVQTSNIEASETAKWEDRWFSVGIRPIGNKQHKFTGRYNGGGYKISNLSILRPDSNYVGLFGYVSNATIEGVNLINANIWGSWYVGGIVGRAESFSLVVNSTFVGDTKGRGNLGGIVGQSDSSTVSNNHHSGMLRATDPNGASSVGGIVGFADNSTVSECSNYGDFSYTSFTVGGIVGSNNGSEVKNCFNTGNVSGYQEVGGIVGANYRNSIVTNCYNTGAVSSNGTDAGGVVGVNDSSSIINTYNTGYVYAAGKAGGVAGHNTSNAKISNSYSAGILKASVITGGGVVGYNSSSIVESSFWNKELVRNSTIAGIGYDDNGQHPIGLSTNEFKKQNTFNTWDFNSVWMIREDTTYPALISASDNAPFAFVDTINGLKAGASFAIHELLKNDWDYESLQKNIILMVDTVYKASRDNDSIYIPAKSQLRSVTLIYRVGEVRSQFNDTLWGNKIDGLLLIDNSPPKLVDTLYTISGKRLSVSLDLLANDHDGDSDVERIVDSTRNGSLDVINDSLVYTPNPSFAGLDSMQLIVGDGKLFDTAWVYFVVRELPVSSVRIHKYSDYSIRVMDANLVVQISTPQNFLGEMELYDLTGVKILTSRKEKSSYQNGWQIEIKDLRPRLYIGVLKVNGEIVSRNLVKIPFR